MCAHVATYHLEKPFKLFLWLKLLYSTGKFKSCPTFKKAICQLMGLKDLRTLNTNLTKLQQLGWIKYNSQTGYYLIVSFDKLKKKYALPSRFAYECSFRDLSNIHAFIGGALFTYLHRDYWRKKKKRWLEREKWRSYTAKLSFSKKSLKQAEISILGVAKIFNLSTSKVAYLKHQAAKMEYIVIKKNYKELEYPANQRAHLIKYNIIPPYTKTFNDKLYLQQIDIILPVFHLRKQHKRTT